MTGNQFKAVVDFENALAVGQAARVVWTNSGNLFACDGTVAKINAKSVRVRLGGEYRGYTAGREIIVPLLSDIKKWSAHNRVEPVGGYPKVD